MYYQPRMMGKGGPMGPMGGKGGPMGGKGGPMGPMGPMGGKGGPFPPGPPGGKGFPMMGKGGKGMMPPFAGKGPGPMPMPPRGMPPFGHFPGMAPPPGPPPQMYGLPFPTMETVFPFLQRERKLPELCKRQPRLYYSQDMIQEVCHWVDAREALEIPLEKPTNFVVESEKVTTLPSDFERPTEDNGTDRYSARVMLLSPLKTEEKKHIMQKIRFVVAQDSKGHVVPFGGEWSPKDGADPTKDSTLVATAIRHTKAQCGLDLSRCKKWIKFTEVQYRRKSGAIDHTIVFVPDVWNAFPEGEEKVEFAKAMMKEDKEVEEEQDVEEDQEVEREIEVEEEAEGGDEGVKKEIIRVKKVIKEVVKRTVKKKVKVAKEGEKVALRPQEITLQALVDAITVDAGESSVEAVLFGAAFDEMVGYINAKQILKTLRKKKKEGDEQAAALKRKREEEQAERQTQMQKQREEYEAKKRKLDEATAQKEALLKQQEEEEKTMDEEEVKRRKEAREKAEQEERQKQVEEAKQKQDDERRKKEEEARLKKEEEEEKRKAQEAEDRERGYRIVKQTVTHIDEEMCAPFQYFDKPTGASGQIRKEIIEGLLHALGELTQREVDALLRAAGVQPDRANSPLLYRRLASYTTTEEKRVDLPPEKKEEPPKAPEPSPAEAKAAQGSEAGEGQAGEEQYEEGEGEENGQDEGMEGEEGYEGEGYEGEEGEEYGEGDEGQDYGEES